MIFFKPWTSPFKPVLFLCVKYIAWKWYILSCVSQMISCTIHPSLDDDCRQGYPIWSFGLLFSSENIQWIQKTNWMLKKLELIIISTLRSTDPILFMNSIRIIFYMNYIKNSRKRITTKVEYQFSIVSVFALFSILYFHRVYETDQCSLSS